MECEFHYLFYDAHFYTLQDKNMMNPDLKHVDQ